MAFRLFVAGLLTVSAAGAVQIVAEVAMAANVDVTAANSQFEDGDGDSDTAIQAGDTVTWTFADSAPHSVTSDTGAFNSGAPQTGGTFQFTFDDPGTYDYYCSVHGAAGGLGMSGTITVQEAATNTPQPTNTTAAAGATDTPTRTRTFTPEPTSTGTVTPAPTSPAATATAIEVMPISATEPAPPAPSSGAGQAVTAPSTGAGSSSGGGVSVEMLTIALAILGVAMIGGAAAVKVRR
jgi:plastocyanin